MTNVHVDIEQFEHFIKSREEPFIQSIFFKLCKELYLKKGEELKKLIFMMNTKDQQQLNKKTMLSILKQVENCNRGRKAACFVFIVLAKSMGLLNADAAADLLSDIDYDSNEHKIGAIIASTIFGVLVGSWFAMRFH